MRGNRGLDLWPLVDYGVGSTHRLEGVRRSSESSPQVYFRREPDRLLYAALTGDIPIGERSDVLDSFQKLFCVEQPIKSAPPDDYEKEIAADSELLVGREKEIEQAKAAIKETQQGVLWISGPGGNGKSFLLARLAQDLRGDPRRTCRIAWRFQASDQRRCNRVAFLRHAVQQLSAWLFEKKAISEIEQPDQDPVKLEKQFIGLLDNVFKFSRVREANVNDDHSAYCIYDRKAENAEFDLFYPAGDTPAEAQNAERAAQAAIGGKLESVRPAGADQATTNAGSAKDNDPSIVVRKRD